MDFIYILMYKRTYGKSQKISKFCHQLKHIQYNFPFFFPMLKIFLINLESWLFSVNWTPGLIAHREMWYIFSLSWWQRNLILLFSLQKTLCKTRNTCKFHLYCWNHIYKVNECCLVENLWFANLRFLLK